MPDGYYLQNVIGYVEETTALSCVCSGKNYTIFKLQGGGFGLSSSQLNSVDTY